MKLTIFEEVILFTKHFKLIIYKLLVFFPNIQIRIQGNKIAFSVEPIFSNFILKLYIQIFSNIRLQKKKTQLMYCTYPFISVRVDNFTRILITLRISFYRCGT